MKIRQLFRRARLRSTEFSIVANNCWAGEVYRDFDLSYSTPFVGLFLYPQSYLNLLSDFSRRIDSQLSFTSSPRDIPTVSGRHADESAYPIGTLGSDVEIHFLHYHSPEEAFAKWNRRRDRLQRHSARLFFKMCDRDGATVDDLLRFDKLPFENKVCFTAKPLLELRSAVWVRECESEEHVVDGAALFAVGMRYFDHVKWINRGVRRAKDRR